MSEVTHVCGREAMSACSSGKRMFGSQRAANRAVTNAAKRGELPPMRHYLCDECGHWHLSRKKRPAGRRDNERKGNA